MPSSLLGLITSLRYSRSDGVDMDHVAKHECQRYGFLIVFEDPMYNPTYIHVLSDILKTSSKTYIEVDVSIEYSILQQFGPITRVCTHNRSDDVGMVRNPKHGRLCSRFHVTFKLSYVTQHIFIFFPISQKHHQKPILKLMYLPVVYSRTVWAYHRALIVHYFSENRSQMYRVV